MQATYQILTLDEGQKDDLVRIFKSSVSLGFLKVRKRPFTPAKKAPLHSKHGLALAYGIQLQGCGYRLDSN